MKQDVQTDPSCLGFVGVNADLSTATKPAACVENRRWELHDVMYATVNVQGTCNNLCSSGAGDGSTAPEVASRSPSTRHETRPTSPGCTRRSRKRRRTAPPRS